MSNVHDIKSLNPLIIKSSNQNQRRQQNMQKLIFIITFMMISIPYLQPYSHAWPIPHSGQTKCYDNETEIPCPKPGEPFYGQSGNYIINPKSFTKLDEHGNELPDDAEDWLMVRDNVTGLIWEVKQAGDNKQDYNNPHDADNIYTWYDTNPETYYGYTGTYNDGKNTEMVIKQINASRFGGFGDWRLPSIKKQASLAALERYLPAINQFYFRGYWSAFYWSSTSNALYTGHAWGVDFGNGGDYNRAKDSSYYVRAVRGGQCRSFDHLLINTDQTVTDTSTGLIWSVEPSETTMNWEMALKYCETYSLADYSDWRLPEREELRSIVDYTMYYPAIDTNYFQTMSAFYWSSTSYASNTGDAWGVSFPYGNATHYAKDSSYYVRAVRGGQCRSFGHLIIWSPMQADILITGTSLPISWDTSTIEGNVTITLSRMGGKADTFETIISETANDGHYDWTITGPPSPNCMLKIEPVSFPYSGTQQSFFTIKNPDMKIHTNEQSNFSISGPESFTGTGPSQTIENALPGTYTITYSPLTCWQTPVSESQTLTYWGTLEFSGEYGQISADPIQNLRADQAIKTWSGNNQMNIQWKPINPCLAGYAFVWDQHNNTEPADVITGTYHQTISPPLENGNNHWFHIKAINIHGNASETAHIGPFYIDTSMLPNTPENLMVKTSTKDSVQLGWTPTPDMSVYYTIYRSKMADGIYYPIHSNPIGYFDAIINGFWDTGIAPDTTFYYKIKSCREGLESLNFSNSVHFTSPDNYPTFDVVFKSKKHQIVAAGTKVTYQMYIEKTEAFQGYLDI